MNKKRLLWSFFKLSTMITKPSLCFFHCGAVVISVFSCCKCVQLITFIGCALAFETCPKRSPNLVLNFKSHSHVNNFPHLPHRTAAEAMVMNPPEPAKEKEKQGFFRAIKKKKKKTQIVRTFKHTYTFLWFDVVSLVCKV